MDGHDIPQANSLDRVRAVVRAILEGAEDPENIGKVVALSPRHTDYYLQAARILELIEQDARAWSVTETGRELLRTPARSQDEAHLFRQAVTQSPVGRLVPELLDPEEPKVDDLTDRIQRVGKLSFSTARRRAQALLAWRERLLHVQELLFLDPADASGGARQPAAPKKKAVVPPHLTRIRLTDFKNFKGASLDVGAFTVLIGTNAVGKSNLRDAFRFLHGIARGYTLAEIIGEKWVEGGVLQWKGIRGGLREATFHRKTSFSLEVDFVLYDDGVRRAAHYEIEIAIDRRELAPRVLREKLVLQNRGQFVFDSHPEKSPPAQDDPVHLAVRIRKPHQSGFVGPTVAVISDRPAISQLAEHRDANREVRRHAELALSAFRSMRFLDLSPEAMRMPSLPGQSILGDRGENLSSVLYAICKSKTKKQALIEWIRELTPMDAKDFRFPVDQTGRVLVSLVEESGTETSAYSASDGTLRFLAMIAALLGPEPANFYFFEELENGINPTRLHLLVELIEQQTRGGRCQVIASSHSPQLLQYLSPDSQRLSSLVYRIAGKPEARIKRIVEIPGAMQALEKEDLATLHSTGWLEDAVAFGEARR